MNRLGRDASLGVRALAVSAFALGCASKASTNAEHDGGDITDATAGGDVANACNTIPMQFEDVVAKWRAAPGACNVDADCSIIRPSIGCDADSGSASSLEDCEIAVSSSASASLAQDLAALNSALCASRCGGGGSPECKPVRAACVAGRCAVSVLVP
jgi:hypothetical protein